MSWQPTIVIATHQRVTITHKLIDSLWAQHPNLHIVLVVSIVSEFDHFKKVGNHRLHVIIWSNKPLGGKWQQGVNVAKSIGANPVIILGSDDQLNPEYVANALQLLEQGYEFIGLRRWKVKYQKSLYLLDYNPIIPLGGGRVYSKNILDAVRWQLFQQKDKHLDDYGWSQVVKSKRKAIVITDVERYNLIITAIKGDWPMMNPFNPKHKNVKILNTEKCAE